MNNSDNFYSFLEMIFETCKFHGPKKAFQVAYYYTLYRYFKKNALNIVVFGFNLTVLNAKSILNILFELFGLNVYYFKAKTRNPVILDIGANIGDSVIYFKWLYPYSKIYAFEPHPQAYDLLTENVKNNRLQNIKLYNFALGSKNKIVTLKADNKDTFESSTLITKDSAKRGLYRGIKVTVKRLTEFPEIAKIRYIDLIKIDIEGNEADLFDSIDTFLKKTGQIILEYHLITDVRQNSFDLIISKLKKYGFKISIFGFYRNQLNFANSFVFMIAAVKI